ncbi:MAG: hypothetical protein WDO72_20085 [Pseudomonadota bacterium]
MAISAWKQARIKTDATAQRDDTKVLALAQIAAPKRGGAHVPLMTVKRFRDFLTTNASKEVGEFPRMADGKRMHEWYLARRRQPVTQPKEM